MVSKGLTVLAVILLLLPDSTTLAVGPGDEGPRVIEVQQILSDFGYTVHVDGIYGPQTTKAVKSWQRSNGLTVDGIVGPVTLQSLRSAIRMNNAMPVGPTEPTGIQGKPFAPGGLAPCDEMRFYREQWNLPEAFDGIGWRESRCRNDVVSSIGCCYGYWQNYISSHLSRQSAYRFRIIESCKVTGVDDIYGNNPLQKQKQACVTYVVYSISGYSPWAATA